MNLDKRGRKREGVDTHLIDVATRYIAACLIRIEKKS